MHNLSSLFRFHPRNEGPSCLKGACRCVNTNICKKCLGDISFLTKSILNNTKGGANGPQPSFYWKLGTGKINQTDE